MAKIKIKMKETTVEQTDTSVVEEVVEATEVYEAPQPQSIIDEIIDEASENTHEERTYSAETVAESDYEEYTEEDEEENESPKNKISGMIGKFGKKSDKAKKERPKKEKTQKKSASEDTDMSILDWVITLLLLGIPVVGLVMFIIWLVSDKTPQVKKNFLIAEIIMIAIGILLIIFLSTLGVGIITALLASFISGVR